MIDPLRRNVEQSRLHPVFRRKLRALLAQLKAEGLPFRPFECFRSPQRQEWLYQQGRTRPGAIVTRARPWESFHQYGLAADLVLHQDGRWNWEMGGRKARWWRRLHDLGREQGLEPLTFEFPHLQLAGVELAQLRAGVAPGGGDETWSDAMESAAATWAGTPASPPFQLPTMRPPLAA